MQLFSADGNVFKKNFKKFFDLEKVKKRVQTLLFHSPAQTTAPSPELIFHTVKALDQTSVLLSVGMALQGRQNLIFCKAATLIVSRRLTASAVFPFIPLAKQALD